MHGQGKVEPFSFDLLIYFFNLFLSHWVYLGLDLKGFFSVANILGSREVKKDFWHMVNTWFCKIKFNFTDLKQLRLELKQEQGWNWTSSWGKTWACVALASEYELYVEPKYELHVTSSAPLSLLSLSLRPTLLKDSRSTSIYVKQEL